MINVICISGLLIDKITKTTQCIMLNLIIELCQDGDVKYTTAIDHSNFHVVTAMLCEDNVWRPVCDNDWNYRDATVLCRGSGHSEYGTELAVESL